MGVVRVWNRFWFAEAPLTRLALFRICILLLALYAAPIVNLQDAAGRPGLDLTREWQPIYAFEVLGIDPPGLAMARSIFAALMASIVLGVLGLFTRTSCALAAVLSFYWFGLAYSFGQVHHSKVALMFALIALPLSPCGARYSVDALITRARAARRGAWAPGPETSPLAGWPILFTQVVVAIGYFFAGATKLAIAGFEWMNGYTLQAIMLDKGSAWSGFLSQSVLLSSLMSAGLLLIQVSFPLIFLHPLLRWFFVPAAISFHLVAWKTMDTGTYFPLWGTLVCFIPLEQTGAFLKRVLTRGPVLRRAAAALLITAVGTGLLLLYFMKVPLAFALLPLAALALAVFSHGRFAPRQDVVESAPS